MTALLATLVGLSVQCAAAPSPRFFFAMPQSAGIGLRPVLEQRDDASFDSPAHFRLGVDPTGRAWFGETPGTHIVEPGDRGSIIVDRPFTDLVWLANGEKIACTAAGLVAVRTPENSGSGKDTPGALWPVSSLPGEGCRLFPAGDAAIYLLDSWRGLTRVFLIDPSAARKIVNLAATPSKVNAAAGDGGTTFIAAGNEILQLSDSAAPKLLYRAAAPVTGLAYSRRAGLFYSTKDAVGFIDPRFRMDFLRVKDPEIVLHGDELYVRLSQSFAVVAVTGADKFKTLRWPKQASSR